MQQQSSSGSSFAGGSIAQQMAEGDGGLLGLGKLLGTAGVQMQQASTASGFGGGFGPGFGPGPGYGPGFGAGFSSGDQIAQQMASGGGGLLGGGGGGMQQAGRYFNSHT